MDAAPVQRTYSRKRQRLQAPSQDSFGLAALRNACRDSDERGAAAEPASCATGVRHGRSEPLRSAAAKPAARLDSPASTAGHLRKAAAAQRRPLTQLHLDLGQANFASTTCSVCGMMYCQGQESDEKLHAAYHSSHLQGIRFQARCLGWQTERVVQRNASSGRILLVLPHDPAAHQRKARLFCKLSLLGPCSTSSCVNKPMREVCAFLEDELGLVPGWLLSVPVKVFLFVSSRRRVVGCAVMEAITTAFPAMRTATAAVPPTTLLPSPAARPAAVPASSCCSAASQGPLQGSTLCGNAIACGASAPVLEAAVADCASPFPLSRHAEAAQAPAVQLSGACHAAEAQASAPGTPAAPLGLCAEPRACLQGSVFRQGFSRTPCSAAGCKGRAGAPGHLRALTPTLSGSGSTLLTRWLAGGCAGVRQKPDLGAQPGEDATAHVGKSQMDGACLAEGHGVGHVRVSQAAGAAVSQARTAPDSEQAGACPAGAAAVSQPAGCHAELGAAQPAAAPAPPGVCMSAPALLGRPAQSTGAAPACADVLGVSRAAVLGGQPGAGAAVNCPGAVRRAAPVLAPALARGAVAADEGRPRRAACGVRVMWVSAGARRQGIASRLMDAARRAFIVTSWCHCIAGYVVPRAELAFTNPTAAGCAFARAYSQTDEFLVYK